MIKFFLFLLSLSLFSCMAGTATVKVDTVNYPQYKENILKSVKKVQIIPLDSNQSIELSTWRSIKGAENEMSLSVKKGDKLHIIKHKVTSIFPTAFEGVMFNSNDTLYCSSISNWVDPVGHSQYMLDLAVGKPAISNTKSYVAYNGLALLSSTAGYYYITYNNPLFSKEYVKRNIIIHAVSDAAIVLGVIGIFSENNTMITGGFGLGIFSKIFNIFQNEYITEYNRYSVDY